MPPPHGGRPEWSRPEWIVGRDGNLSMPVGERVAVDLEVAASPTARVRLHKVAAFPKGFEFDIAVQFVVIVDAWDPMQGLAGLRGRPGDTEGVLSDEHLRLRILFADGSEVNNLGPPMSRPVTPGPFLQYWDGRGVNGRGAGQWSAAEATLWVWPLPPPGPLAFVCEWPAHGIAARRHEIDAGVVLEAARRAADMWPEG